MDAQLVLAVLVVALALIHLIWRGARLIRGVPTGRGCGRCNGCGGSTDKPMGSNLVSLGLPKGPPRHDVD